MEHRQGVWLRTDFKIDRVLCITQIQTSYGNFTGKIRSKNNKDYFLDQK